MHDAENACDTGRLARTVESAEWLRDSVGSSEWACPTCQRLAEVVLPALQMLEKRVRALEVTMGRADTRVSLAVVRQPPKVRHHTCGCGRVFQTRSALKVRCDVCTAEMRREWATTRNDKIRRLRKGQRHDP